MCFLAVSCNLIDSTSEGSQNESQTILPCELLYIVNQFPSLSIRRAMNKTVNQSQLFSSVQLKAHGVYVLGKTHMRSTLSLISCDIAFETVPMFV